MIITKAWTKYLEHVAQCTLCVVGADGHAWTCVEGARLRQAALKGDKS